MIVYRVYGIMLRSTSIKTDVWSEPVIEWHPQKGDAIAKHDKMIAAGYTEVRTTSHEIPPGRECVCVALNLSQDNFSNWPGKLVKRTIS